MRAPSIANMWSRSCKATARRKSLPPAARAINEYFRKFTIFILLINYAITYVFILILVAYKTIHSIIASLPLIITVISESYEKVMQKY
jgi:hypothetical protein